MTPAEQRAADLDGIAAALARAFPDRTEELLAETTFALWPFAFVCWLCSLDWHDRGSVCGACRRSCRALVEQARLGRSRPPSDMVISELGRALALADFPRSEAVIAAVRKGLIAVDPENVPPCRFCDAPLPHRQLDAMGHDRRICSGCVVRIATAGDGPLFVR